MIPIRGSATTPLVYSISHVHILVKKERGRHYNSARTCSGRAIPRAPAGGRKKKLTFRVVSEMPGEAAVCTAIVPSVSLVKGPPGLQDPG